MHLLLKLEHTESAVQDGFWSNPKCEKCKIIMLLGSICDFLCDTIILKLTECFVYSQNEREYIFHCTYVYHIIQLSKIQEIAYYKKAKSCLIN